MEKRRIGVRAIIFKNGKLLATKFRTENGSASDFWCTPGGGLDSREGLIAGISREIVEETGIAPRVGRLLFIQQFDSGRTGHDEELEFFFHVENPGDYESIDLTTTSHGLAEIAQIAFINPAEHRLLPTFLQKIDIQDYIDHDRPVLITNEL